MSWFKNPASCHFIMLTEINDAVLQYRAWIMFSIHMPQKFTSKRFPSDSAKQCKLCLAEYAVKNSCSSQYPNCWSYWNRMRFILANLQIVIWFEAGIVRRSCVCLCLGTDGTGELRRKCRVGNNRIYCAKKAEWTIHEECSSAAPKAQRRGIVHSEIEAG